MNCPFAQDTIRILTPVILTFLILFACGTPRIGTTGGAPASETVKQQITKSDSSSFPEGILHYGRFEPSNPLPCVYLDRVRTDLSAEAEAWLVEHHIGEDGFPINLYGKYTPSWAQERTVFVYCAVE